MSTDTAGSSPDSALERLFYHTDRIQFFYWREFSGAKPTVLLIGLLGVLTFITGLSNLSQVAVPLDGPFAEYVAVSESYVRFAGVFFSFILVSAVFGLNRRKRLAWYVATFVIPLVAIIPLFTFQVNDVLVFLLSVIVYPLLIYNRHRFDRRLDLSPIQIAALSSIIGVLAYATVGSYGMRDRYVGIETWTDAFYYVIVTIATVGYGDATPLTQETKLFTLSFIIFGTAAFTAAIGSLLIPAIESRMAAAVGNMTPSELKLLEDHVLVLGYGDLTEPIITELEAQVDLVVITPDASDATMLRDRDISVLTADPTDTESLHDANIEMARGVVVATEDDAQDVLAIIAVKQTNPDVFVVAAANRRQHVDKLELVGADEVISPTVIGGKVIGRSVLQGERLPLEDALEATDEES